MSNHSEYTKSYIRFFANISDNGFRTINELVNHLGFSDREVNLSKRKVRHTIGDLTYRGILESYRIPKCKYKVYRLSSLGKTIASEFHVVMSSGNLVFHDVDEILQHHSATITKENDHKVPDPPRIVAKQVIKSRG